MVVVGLEWSGCIGFRVKSWYWVVGGVVVVGLVCSGVIGFREEWCYWV